MFLPPACEHEVRHPPQPRYPLLQVQQQGSRVLVDEGEEQRTWNLQGRRGRARGGGGE